MREYNPDRAISSVPISLIDVGERARPLCETEVDRLVESIRGIGMQTPISLWSPPEGNAERYRLVAGLHRLEACRRLGKSHIDARIIELDEIDRRMWEIAENLHRAKLTDLEEAAHIAEWSRLSEERRQAAQVEQAVLSDGRKAGPQHQASGTSAAARALGIDRNKVQRAVKVDALDPEAKAEARAQGLDDNQSALLKAAKYPSKEEQIRALREEGARKSEGRNNTSSSAERIEAAVNAVKRLSPEELAVFADWFDTFRAERGERASGDGADKARAKIPTKPGWTMRI